MVKRFFAVFGLVMLFMAILAILLLAVILLAGDNDSAILVAILVIFVVGLGAFVPYLDWAVKRVFRFPGEGTPVPEADLRAQIQALNQFDAPVMVEERKGNLVAAWKYVDTAVLLPSRTPTRSDRCPPAADEYHRFAVPLTCRVNSAIMGSAQDITAHTSLSPRQRLKRWPGH